MKEKNIENLTSLWLLAGKAFDMYRTVSDLQIVNIPFSEWPNRIWSLRGISAKEKDIVREIMMKNNPAMIFSEWKDSDERDSADDYGMKIKSMQTGMSLRLSDYDIRRVNSRVDLVRVENNVDAGLWSHLFLQSFDYFISDEIVDRIKERVFFYCLKYGKYFVGTVAVYRLENSIGVHSLGVVKQFRRRGLAEEVMKIIIEKAKRGKFDYVHLQSSPMGINIYKKLGFEEIFKIYNYILK